MVLGGYLQLGKKVSLILPTTKLTLSLFLRTDRCMYPFPNQPTFSRYNQPILPISKVITISATTMYHQLKGQ